MLRYCVIGHPIAHSLSPRLHNAAFKAFGIAARYEAREVKPSGLASFMKTFRTRYAGANVTIPHKQSIIEFIDELSPEARAIGAVNAIVNKSGVLVGHNTDLYGAIVSLRKKLHSLRNRRVIMLGAGGAARAVVYGLKKAGAKIVVLNRTPFRAEVLARDFAIAYGQLEDLQKHLPCDIIVNTTSAGMVRNETPVPRLGEILKNFKKKPLVMDIIYRPRLTKLLADAEQAGCRVINGEAMFLTQAARSFCLWTGKKRTGKFFTFLKIRRP